MSIRRRRLRTTPYGFFDYISFYYKQIVEYFWPSRHLRNLSIALLGRINNQGNFQIGEHELWWRARAAILLASGYRLRARFRPRWIPSWLGRGHSRQQYEDALRLKIEKVIDAERIADKTTVAVKAIARGSPEIDIAKMLSSEELMSDPRNHCVPILDCVTHERYPEAEFMIMPLLRHFEDPEFYTVDEVFSFACQVLEGLAFMHLHGVAHGDCTSANIMMDGSSIYPGGFHPSHQERTRDGTSMATYLSRSDVGDVKYYFVDYSHSTVFVDGLPRQGRLATRAATSDASVDDQIIQKAEDAFSEDVRLLGETLEKSFIFRYRNVSFLTPLIAAMTQMNPVSRFTASHALACLRENYESRRQLLASRLVRRDETFISKVLHDIEFTLSRMFFYVRTPLRRAAAVKAEIAYLLAIRRSRRD